MIALITTTAIGAVVALVVGVWGDSILDWIYNRDPLEVQVTAQTRRPPAGYTMVVPDPDQLPSNLGPRPADYGDSCDRLWRIGLDSGGIQADGASYSVLLKGNAREGLAIVDMRAVVTERMSAENGVRLICTLQRGGADSIPLTFNFTRGISGLTHPGTLVDETPAEYRNDEGKWDERFADGYVITVEKDESVPLNIAALTRTDEAFRWHIEADIVVGGDRRTITIRNGEDDFFSPGIQGEYVQTFNSGSSAGEWGPRPR